MSTAVATATPVATTTRQPITHTVEVGKADYTFVPDIVLAEVGDYIAYAFYPRNHSVVRADYEYPCIPYELVNTSPGFYSGFIPVDTILDEPATYTVRVNDTEPIFVYCSGTGACIDYGMVSVVNPNANTSLDQHRKWAKEAQFMLQPGEKWPTEGADPSEDDGHDEEEHTTTSATLPATVTLIPTATATSDAANTVASSQTHHGLSTGAIAGIAIGAAAVALIAAIALWICGRRSRGRRNPESTNDAWFLGTGGKKEAYKSAATPATMPPDYNAHGMPAMAHASKVYPGVNGSAVEHYGLGAGSPPLHMSPHYAQQNFPPHVLDPAAFSHNPYVGTTGMGQSPPTQQQQVYMPEMYSGTPVARSPPPPSTTAPSTSPMPTAAAMGNRHSVTMSHASRGGSPDILHEMNGLRSPIGTVHQGNGTLPTIQQPTPQRDGIGL